ncbi:RNA ligase, Rnl2 family [Pelomyxa schiedti]|nr:RNA ligase, Rnl2 family [Pelomyxa schiedti]
MATINAEGVATKDACGDHKADLAPVIAAVVSAPPTTSPTSTAETSPAAPTTPTNATTCPITTAATATTTSASGATETAAAKTTAAASDNDAGGSDLTGEEVAVDVADDDPDVDGSKPPSAAATGAAEEGLKFKQYPSFDNIGKPGVLDPVLAKYGKDEFVVTEKVHGSNFSFITNGKELITAKRGGLLHPSAKFFNFTRVLDKYKDRIMQAFVIAQKRFGFTRLHVFGEFFGGEYPHEGVPKIPDAVSVQRRLYYSNDNEFFVFDLSGGVGFVDYDDMLSICQEAGLLCAQPLFRGTLAECVKFPVVFPTTISGMLGLPPIPDNNAEGVVIKRVKHSRPLFKSKNPKFEEVAYLLTPEKRIADAAKREIYLQKKAERAQLGPTTPTEPAAPSPLFIAASAYVTSNRLDSVISKIGQVTIRDSAKLMGLLVQDALKDFEKDNEEYRVLAKDEQRKINKLLMLPAKNVVTQHFA